MPTRHGANGEDIIRANPGLNYSITPLPLVSTGLSQNCPSFFATKPSSSRK